ncbi:MAG: hypothetical protein K2Y37_16150 [Pirellulales bacterium]|nr:hypothetical protein [Pirellulales bacterium]
MNNCIGSQGSQVSRRRVLQLGVGTAVLAATSRQTRGALPNAQLRLAMFSANVTPPIGHPCMGGGIAPAGRIDDRLGAHGIVLLGSGEPIVLVAVDWCEIRNDAYDRWRHALAEAAATSPVRVLVASVHQHDTPVADLTAERLLEDANLKGRICDVAFHERAVTGVAKALRAGLAAARPVTHLGTGMARVEHVASNRRFTDSSGRLRFDRTSASRDAEAHRADEGTIDPWLRTLSFFDGDTPLAALSAYATHPMSYYGQGGVSCDFVGQAREARRAVNPQVQQVYFSGASGNVTAGKYNDGDPANRARLAERMAAAMHAAWSNTKREPIAPWTFRSVPLELKPRTADGFAPDELAAKLVANTPPFQQCLAAMGASWHARVAHGQPIDLPVIDFGPALVVLLPGEAYVEYQLLAQQLRPDRFIFTIGYGECATGYIPIERAWQEHDTNLRDWCWVAPGAETVLTDALRKVLEAR